MRRFREVFRYELRGGLRRISTWVYFGIFFTLAFVMVSVMGGAFGGGAVAFLGAGGQVHVNAPYIVGTLTAVFSVFGVLVTAAILGNAVFKDYESGMHPLFFTAPLSRLDYLGGRFLGALAVALVVFAGIPLGMMVAAHLPWVDADRFGPFRLDAYAAPYLLYVVPNTLFTGAIFFALATRTRQMLPNYLGGVGLLIGYLLAAGMADNLDNERLAAMLDPFGLVGTGLLTRYWTPVERNLHLIPAEGVLLWNRLLWMGVGLAILGAVAATFRFAHAAPGGRRARRRERRREAVESAEARGGPVAPIRVPRSAPASGAATRLKQLWTVTWMAFHGAAMNRYFAGIVGAGLLFLVVSAVDVGQIYGTPTWPVTYMVLEILGGTFALFVIVVITFLGGEMVWRERDVGTHQIHDALPLPRVLVYLGKLLALLLVIVVLLAVLMLAGILTQAFHGYTRFEPGLYLRYLFGIQLADYALFAVFVLFVHALVDHKYLGHLIVVLYFVVTLFMVTFGLEHNLYQYGSDAGMVYSDMNRFGPFLTPFLWFKAYWAAWALLLAVATNLLWIRGQEAGARGRWRLARARLTRRAAATAALALVLILSTGGFIFYNTNVLNDYRTTRDAERAVAHYESTYKEAWDGAPQPRVTAVDLHLEIYPSSRDLTARGRYTLVNRDAAPIERVLVRLPRRTEVRRFDFAGGAERELDDGRVGVSVWRLATPLEPGGTLELEFDLAYLTEGFGNQVVGLEVVENGTFFGSANLPSFGYDRRGELADEERRRRHDLPPRERMADLDDPEARRNNYITPDADWVTFRATLGTEPDQVAIAPGYLRREWTENGRRYFSYEMDAPILHFYSFLSARYAVHREEWNGVAIEIFHHPTHTYNLERMADAVRRSLDYFTEHFSPYQHRQVRILEFPRYAAFAQSFPNTIPYSEGVGFIARVTGEDDVDYPFYVTAHEVAHQWWAHQVIGADAQGATVLSETLSQYAALMVMEETYGEAQMRRFLRYELDRYLSGRAFERRREMPLMRVEGQQYIHYHKGSLAMYALRDYIGEERVNAALRGLIADHAFAGPPYPTARDLVERLRAETPDSLQYVITDFFEEITLWDNRATAATARELPDGRWELTLTLAARKLRVNPEGHEVEVPMDEWVDVGVFGEEREGRRTREVPLHLEKHRIRTGTNEVRLVLEQRPVRAGIDPLHRLTDRIARDNTTRVSVATD